MNGADCKLINVLIVAFSIAGLIARAYIFRNSVLGLQTTVAHLVKDKGHGATHPTKGTSGCEKLVVTESGDVGRNTAAESV